MKARQTLQTDTTNRMYSITVIRTNLHTYIHTQLLLGRKDGVQAAKAGAGKNQSTFSDACVFVIYVRSEITNNTLATANLYHGGPLTAQTHKFLMASPISIVRRDGDFKRTTA